ncbi:hypothetical protein IQ07DRAFT_54975 [Pyrenochaeta sp. DS3sAY3a]|nr:hypothetical protein IQ07DRAFT_54975 [Pyrenochaeta sp. DS3sAY3a]
MKFTCSILFTILPALAFAAIGDRCNPGGDTEGSLTNTYGICIKTSDCSSRGGKTTNNNCPDDPNNVKCCTLEKCGPWNDGDCQWSQDKVCEKYNGVWLKGYCPGPNSFKCCVQAHN